MLCGLWIRGVFVWSWGRDLDFCTLKGEVSPWTRGSMDILYRNEAYQFHVDETCGYLSVDGRQRCRTLARNNRLFCSGRSAQEQKPSTKPWMQWQKEQDNILGTFWEIALFLPHRAVRFRGLLCYGNWLVNICTPMETSTVSFSHVKR